MCDLPQERWEGQVCKYMNERAIRNVLAQGLTMGANPGGGHRGYSPSKNFPGWTKCCISPQKMMKWDPSLKIASPTSKRDLHPWVEQYKRVGRTLPPLRQIKPCFSYS